MRKEKVLSIMTKRIDSYAWKTIAASRAMSCLSNDMLPINAAIQIGKRGGWQSRLLLTLDYTTTGIKCLILAHNAKDYLKKTHETLDYDYIYNRVNYRKSYRGSLNPELQLVSRDDLPLYLDHEFRSPVFDDILSGKKKVLFKETTKLNVPAEKEAL